MSEYIDQNYDIYKHLLVKPISHGQLYTDLIIPPSETLKDLSISRINLLKKSFEYRNTNLISIIVRRVNKDNETFYELIHGADIFLVAKDLDIEMLWAWVFDLSDDDTELFKIEINELFGSQDVGIVEMRQSLNDLNQKIHDFKDEINQKLELILSVISKDINLNSASFDDLINVSGIGDTSAKRIVELRPFNDLKDFKAKYSGKYPRGKLSSILKALSSYSIMF